MAKKKKGAGLPESMLPRLRLSCSKDVLLGPGRVELLELVGQTASLRAAAAQMGMAYMTAWKHVKILNGIFRRPVVVSQRGGNKGGGAELTQFGRRVLEVYHEIEERGHAAMRNGLAEFQSLLKS